jgi:hypothetical protein
VNDIDARIRDALRAAADEVRQEDLHPAASPRSSRYRAANRWIAPMLAAAAVIAVVATSVALSGSPTASRHVPAAGSPTPAHSSSPSPARTTVRASGAAGSSIAPPVGTRRSIGSSTSNSGSPASTTVQANAAGAACFFADACSGGAQTFYEPLWPFANYSQAGHWETVDGPNGHSPWHLDAKATALSFADGFLQFTDITIVTTARIGVDQAHVGVGFRDANGTAHTSAVLHLVRYERTLGDTKAGWEVVGSDDTTFSVERPAYGSAVSSPMTVGGHITGVDENIRVVVRTLGGVVGNAAPLPAGGATSPWSVRVSFSGSGVLTVVASTGGHLIQHERFAIQGVHTGG